MLQTPVLLATHPGDTVYKVRQTTATVRVTGLHRVYLRSGGHPSGLSGNCSRHVRSVPVAIHISCWYETPGGVRLENVSLMELYVADLYTGVYYEHFDTDTIVCIITAGMTQPQRY